MSYRFKEARLRAGLTTAELAKLMNVSQSAASQWDSGKKVPTVDTLCKLADFYDVSIDYLLGRSEKKQYIPVNDEIIPVEVLPFLHGKPVWDETHGWGLVNAALDHVLFTNGSKVIFAEAMNLRSMPIAYSMGYSPTTRPISYDDLIKHKSLWIQPISTDSFLRDELTGWYQVHDFYVENQYGTRFLFDTYGAKWLAFNMKL